MGSSSDDDRRVLLEFFGATNGSSWKNNAGWNTEASMSTWYGVSVDEDCRVVELKLVDNLLAGYIPESLGQLPSLTFLNLSRNQLAGDIPESLGQLTSLKTLYLFGNHLTGAIPDNLGQLPSLTFLNLSKNRLTGAIPESLGNLSSLTSLYMFGNQLTGAIPESLGRLSSLTSLNLSENQLTGAIPESLGLLSSLTCLYLSSNQLTGAIPESLGLLSSLTSLYLLKNQLTGAIPESLGKLSSLEYLYLSRNQLTGAIPESFGDLSSLKTLNLAENQLSGAIPESLGQLSSLNTLVLSSNQLTGAIPESLGKLSNLTSLYLSSNQLRGFPKEAASGLQHLDTRKVTLSANAWARPPAGVVGRGLKIIVRYWEAIERSGGVVSSKLKVVLIGAVKAGKTSLAKGMIHGKPQLCHEDDRTKGVDVNLDAPCNSNATGELELIFWDFAGHSEYYSTHQLFLSKGALHLLVVDLKRFSDEPTARSEQVDLWLDALQCRVPGANFIVIATQIDRLVGDHEADLGNLKRTIEDYLSAKRNELDRVWHDSSMTSDLKQGLIFHGVESVSSTRTESLLDLRLKLFTLVYSKQDMFPSVGRLLPASWVRVENMLNAKRLGKDPILKASRVGHQKKRDVIVLGTDTSGVGQKFLNKTDAINEWNRVVRTLRLGKEVGSTFWGTIARAFKQSEDNERTGGNAVFEDATAQLVLEGTILDSGEILYLKPTWINELLRAILDHDLADANKEKFWKYELQTFSVNNAVYMDLKEIHDNFPSTGILTVTYLRFLWRKVPNVDDAVFKSLLGIMSRHGIIFEGNPAGGGNDDEEDALNDNAKLFVPLHLPTNILESDLEITSLLKHQFRKELVYEIRQTYVPPGVLGLLMSRFLKLERVEFRKCWSRGVAFALEDVLVLLHLDTPAHGEDEARITVNLFGERFVSKLTMAMESVKREIKSMFVEHFRGLFVGLKQGYPREVNGINATNRLSSTDVVNAVVERIDGLEDHLDRELFKMLQGLHQIEDNLQDVAKSCRSILARLNKLQSEKMPFPSLLIVRPAAAVLSDKQEKRSLWALVKSLGRRAKKLVRKDMRLCFLCPYDFSEVPCGLDGNGYPISTIQDWITKMRPALKVTAVLVKVVIKAGSGLDLPVSDFLNGAKSYLGEELADRVPDNDTVEQALDGRAAEEGVVKNLVGNAYKEVNNFMERHACEDTGRCVHFDDEMKLVDDGDGGKVWVSNGNVQRWKDAHPRCLPSFVP